ncbi:MAG: MFS transporter, partial [Nitrospinota bacterium]
RRVLRPLAILWVSAVLRSIVTESFVAFIPLFLYEKGHSLMAAGGAVSAFLFAGALAMMLGGHLSDLLDRRRVLLYPPLLAIPFVVLFLSGTGFLQVVALILAGMLLYSSMAVTVAFAQELMPESAGLASSLTMGMVWFTASFAVTGVGALADRIGIGSALGVTLLPLAGSALLAFFLPRRAGEVASVGNSG